MNVGSLFSGIGLLDYGLHRAGLNHRWLCEVDPWRRDILRQRFPGATIYDDVRAVGADAQRVDIIAGGFPCKGASTAGKRNGFDHPETVLWREMARAISELRPAHVIVENVANLLVVRDGAVWGEVLGDLAALGFDVVWDCFPAAAFGAPHLRDRVIAIATYTDGTGQRRGADQWSVSDGRSDARGSAEIASHPKRGGVRAEPEPKPWSDSPGVVAAVGEAAADTDRAGSQEQHGTSQPVRPQQRQPASGRHATSADPSSGGEQRARSERAALGGTASGRGVPVEWGDFAAAIRRWESVVGAAPEPLVRRMDDGRSARVERSRLSALGDGVQVQLGELAGRFVKEMAA